VLRLPRTYPGHYDRTVARVQATSAVRDQGHQSASDRRAVAATASVVSFGCLSALAVKVVPLQDVGADELILTAEGIQLLAVYRPTFRAILAETKVGANSLGGGTAP